MDTDKFLTQDSKTHLSDSPTNSSGRRSSSVSAHSTSPEFEFWMLRNRSDPTPDLLSADELFVNGVLLPLDLLPMKESDPDPASSAAPDPEPPPLAPESGATSKRWRDIFKKDTGVTKKVEVREKKKSQRGGTSTAELNIYIWPFSRSRSAGNGGSRPKMASGAPARKVNSAPCSRSNSAGESKLGGKWPSSPGRAGVHLGRSSPVWQVKRGAVGEKKAGGKKEVTQARRGKIVNAGGSGGDNKGRVLNLNLNVPMCVGYRHHLSCRSNETGAIVVAEDGGGGGGGGGAKADVAGTSGNLFGLRNLFSKKVY